MVAPFNILNVLPGIGHIKSLIHHVMGDTEGGNWALAEATRSAIVIVVGFEYEGPGGPIVAALGAGIIIDIKISILRGRPHGIIKGINHIFKDLARWRVPLESVAETGILIIPDVYYGLVMRRLLDLQPESNSEMLVEIAVRSALRKAFYRTMLMCLLRSQFVQPDTSLPGDK